MFHKDLAASRHHLWSPFAVLAIAVAVAVGLAGCGDDDDPTVPSDTSDEQQVEQGLTDLATFGSAALSTPEVSVLSNQAIVDLLGSVGLELPGFTDGGDPFFPNDLTEMLAGGATTGWRHNLGGSIFEPRTLELNRGFASPYPDFGTYDRDRSDTTEPFPGWVLTLPNEPPDGLIFRFPASEDDIVSIEDGTVTPVQGEVRFLNIVIDDNGTPNDMEDDVITSVDFELALASGDNPLSVVTRITYAVTLDDAGVPTSFAIGDENDISSTFIGPLSFALFVETIDNDATLSLQLVDTTSNPDYVMRWSMTVADFDPETELPATATFTFGFGGTDTPTSPPWVIATTLDNFQTDPEDPDDFIADVDGSISLNGRTMATYAGDTTEVPVNADVDGDGDIDADDTCINIDISFAGPESENICVVFSELADSVPAGGVGLLLTGPACPCAAR